MSEHNWDHIGTKDTVDCRGVHKSVVHYECLDCGDAKVEEPGLPCTGPAGPVERKRYRVRFYSGWGEFSWAYRDNMPEAVKFARACPTKRPNGLAEPPVIEVVTVVEGWQASPHERS